MYCLRAVIAAEHVLGELVRTLGGAYDAHIVFLGQHLSLLPVTDAFFNAVTGTAASRPDEFGTVPATFARALAACSASGPVAYVEAEFFGGPGEQAAQVWDGGEAVLGPLRLGEDEPFPQDGSPISQALRRLGVAKDNHYDEFDAVGLGRHRDTEDWRPTTS